MLYNTICIINYIKVQISEEIVLYCKNNIITKYIKIFNFVID